MPLSYGRYLEPLYEEGNENEGILTLRSILLLLLALFYLFHFDLDLFSQVIHALIFKLYF